MSLGFKRLTTCGGVGVLVHTPHIRH